MGPRFIAFLVLIFAPAFARAADPPSVPPPSSVPSTELGCLPPKLDALVLDFFPGATTKTSLLMNLKLEKLHAAAQADADIREFLVAIQAKLQDRDGWFARRLADPRTPESKVFSEYLDYVILRGAKKAKRPAEELARSAELGFHTADLEEIMDLILRRCMDLEEPIPDSTLEALLRLLQGGADRIEMQAISFLLNKEVSKLHDMEKILRSGTPIPADEFYKAIERLAELDGFTMTNWRPPPKASAVEAAAELGAGAGKAASAQTAAAGSSSTALTFQHTQMGLLVRPDQLPNLAHIRGQSSNVRSAIQSIEDHLASLDRSSAEYLEGQEVYKAYLGVLINDPGVVFRSGGFLDELVAAAVVSGNQKHRERLLHLLLGEFDKARRGLHLAFGKEGETYREVYIAVKNLVASQEEWSPEVVDFVLEQFDWLKQWKHPQDATGVASIKQIEKIKSFRRAQKLDPFEVVEALKRPPGQQKTVRLGTYHITLEGVQRSGKWGPLGKKQKYLRVSSIRSTQQLDTEAGDMLRRIEQMAREQGYEGIELTEDVAWRGIKKNPHYTTEKIQVPVVRDGKVVEKKPANLYVKSFEFKADPKPLNKFLKDPELNDIALDFGGYNLTMRKTPLISFPDKKALTVTLVTAADQGEGFYAQMLQQLSEHAKKQGFQTLMIDGIDDPRHWAFYERQGFKIYPRSNPPQRSYYKDL